MNWVNQNDLPAYVISHSIQVHRMCQEFTISRVSLRAGDG